MNSTRILLTTVALLAGNVELGVAQDVTEQNGQAKCWDLAANQVRTRTEPAENKSRDMPETTVGQGSAEGMSAIAPGAKGTASNTLPGSNNAPSGSVNSRPPGLPDC